MLWKIVKPGDHNEIKPLTGNVIQKYKSIRYDIVMSQFVIVVLICKESLSLQQLQQGILPPKE